MRLILHVDVGQMRVLRRKPGSNDQDKDLGRGSGQSMPMNRLALDAVIPAIIFKFDEVEEGRSWDLNDKKVRNRNLTTMQAP